MPKGIDPKAYAARVTKAKKTVAAIDPAMKKKLEQYYPKISKADLAKQMLSPKRKLSDISDMEKRMKAKPTTTRTPSKSTPTPMPKFPGAKPAKKKNMPKTLTGPAAVRELQRQVSPAGVKKAEANAKKAIAKKYPDLTKKKK
jgi:hypothetical protein